MQSSNVLRSNSTTKWLRSRHIRTSSLRYLHSPQDLSVLEDISKVFLFFARKGKLDCLGFIQMFKSGEVKFPRDVAYTLFKSIPAEEQGGVSELEFREFVLSPGFKRRFQTLSTDIQRKFPHTDIQLPTTVESMMNQLAEKLNKRLIVQAVRSTQGQSSGENLRRLSSLFALAKKHRVVVPDGVVLKSRDTHRNLYIEEVKQKLKMIDGEEELGSLSPMSTKRTPISPIHRKTASMHLPFVI